MSELKIWMNGTLKSQADAVLPVNSAAVFYGTNVFEGLRAYWNAADEELYGFRLKEHFARLRESMKMMRFNGSFTDEQLFAAVHEVLRGNQIREDVHMHLVSYVTTPGMDAVDPVGLYINPRRRPRADAGGLKCCVSSWVRTSDNAIPIRLKSGANYQNGRLALLQARADGYDAPILLNQHGHVAEGTGATFMMVRKGRLVTPPLSGDILESITRETLMEDVAGRVLGMSIVEREIDRTELYVADEVFLCGTGAQISPVIEIDRRTIGTGRPGATTKDLSRRYFDAVRGKVPAYRDWLTPVY
jgi:branched-chain amino acid aminotransferase